MLKRRVTRSALRVIDRSEWRDVTRIAVRTDELMRGVQRAGCPPTVVGDQGAGAQKWAQRLIQSRAHRHEQEDRRDARGEQHRPKLLAEPRVAERQHVESIESPARLFRLREAEA